MTKPIDLDARREQIQTYVKYGAWMLGLALASPVLWMGLQGLIAAILIISILFVVWNFAPVAATYVANKRIQALVAVVEANPIDTMQNLFTEKLEILNDADNKIAEFETEIGNFNDQVSDFRQAYPSEAATYEEISVKMRAALTDMKREQSAARKELNGFEQQINKAKAIYRMATAAQKVIRLSRSAEAQVFARIKEQVAFDTVRTSLNRAFANLNLALERRADTQAFLSGDTKAQAALPAPNPIATIAEHAPAMKIAGRRS